MLRRMIYLKKTLVKNFEYINKVPTNTTINLETSIKYDSEYNEEQKECLGKIFLKIGSKEKEESFFLQVEMHGGFDIDAGNEYTPKQINTETYRLLYPHLQAYISAVTALSGVPALNLPSLPILQQENNK
ncbi:hypothetical protein [Zhenpiania hominis]|uniref:hypothetical protein n=1 Tax=Zhenpiania hominis TaxID=2763644 RepID=UPI0039F6236D